MRSAENVTCRPVLRSAPGALRSIIPAITAHFANVAFMSVDSASHASKSSPSMSSSNNAGRSTSPIGFNPHTATAYSLARKPSGCLPARSSLRESSTPNV